MRVVLYTHDLIPITILNLEKWHVDHLRQYRSVQLWVPPRAEMGPPSMGIEMRSVKIQTVTITCDWLIKNGQTHMMLFTNDEESAMILRAAFLPGQMGQMQEEIENAFSDGFVAGLRM